MEQACRRIHNKGCADHNKYISLGCKLNSGFHIGDSLLEKYDVRTHMVTIPVKSLGSRLQMFNIESVDTVGMRYGTHLHKLTMKMQHIGTSRPFMKIVHILSHDIHIIPLFKLHQSHVGSIRLTIKESFAPLVIELVHYGRITREAIRAAHFHDRIVLP